MSIDWLKFAPALVLLLVPIAVFHGPRVRYRLAGRDWDRHWPQVLTLGLHAIDLGRAALGAWLLAEALLPDPAARGLLQREAVLLTDATVLTLAAVLQTVVCKEPDSFHAPFAFVTGLALGFFPPAVAGFAVVFALVITAGVRVPDIFFLLLALSLYGAGFLFGGRAMLIKVTVAAVPIFLPWLCSVLFSRPLVVSYQSRHARDSRSPMGTPEPR
jgi:hypothetical protein